jgi:hypothetical protein
MKGLIPGQMAPRNFFGSATAKPSIIPAAWTAIASPSGGETLIGITQDTLGHVWTADDNGKVYLSTTGGASWGAGATSGVNPGTIGNIFFAGGVLMLGGDGNPAGLSGGDGSSWGQVTATPDPFGAFMLCAQPSGAQWAGYTNAGGGGDVNNHGYSTDGGAIWTTPGSGGMPGDPAMTGLLPSQVLWDGTEFVFSFSDGSLGVSLDGIAWTAKTAPGFVNATALAKFGAVYVAGSGGAPGNSSLAMAASVAGLQGAPFTPVPNANGDNITGIAGDIANSVYVAVMTGTPGGGAGYAHALTGPWVANDLKFQTGEVAVQVIYDPLHQKFIAVGDMGSVSIAELF